MNGYTIPRPNDKYIVIVNYKDGHTGAIETNTAEDALYEARRNRSDDVIRIDIRTIKGRLVETL